MDINWEQDFGMKNISPNTCPRISLLPIPLLRIRRIHFLFPIINVNDFLVGGFQLTVINCGDGIERQISNTDCKSFRWRRWSRGGRWCNFPFFQRRSRFCGRRFRWRTLRNNDSEFVELEKVLQEFHPFRRTLFFYNGTFYSIDLFKSVIGI